MLIKQENIFAKFSFWKKFARYFAVVGSVAVLLFVGQASVSRGLDIANAAVDGLGVQFVGNGTDWTATIFNDNGSRFEPGSITAEFGAYHCDTRGTGACSGPRLKFETFNMPVPARGSSTQISLNNPGFGNCGRVQVDIGLPNGGGILGGTVFDTGVDCGAGSTPTPTPTSQPTPSPTPGGQACTPGEWSGATCARCNPSGTGMEADGTDWGDFSSNSSGWCGCAQRYSQTTQNKPYDQPNYPQCFGAPVTPTPTPTATPTPTPGGGPQACTPNAFDANSCRRCAADGTFWGTPGSDFGSNGGSGEWCGCALRYAADYSTNANYAVCRPTSPAPSSSPSNFTVSCSSSPSAVNVGQTVTWNASVAGGVAPYTYSWSGGVVGSGQSLQTSYASAGTKVSTVAVTDGTGTVRNSPNCSVAVSEVGGIGGVNCAAFVNRTTCGQPSYDTCSPACGADGKAIYNCYASQSPSQCIGTLSCDPENARCQGLPTPTPSPTPVSSCPLPMGPTTFLTNGQGDEASFPVNQTNFILSWNAIPGATGYTVTVDEVGTAANPDTIATNIQSTSLQLIISNPGRYTWLVRANNACGASGPGGIDFTILAPGASPTPTPSASPSPSPAASTSPAPGGGSTDGRLTTTASATGGQGGNVNLNITQPAAAQQSRPQVAGVTAQITQLPKTGLPVAAWALAAILPLGFKLRSFAKGIGETGRLNDQPHYISQKRIFKK